MYHIPDEIFYLYFLIGGITVFLFTKIKNLYYKSILKKKRKTISKNKTKYHINKSAKYKSPSYDEYIEQCWNEVK